MFEKFTERARKVMSMGRQEAQRLNSEFIGAEHILLGIVAEGGGLAARVLKTMNVDPKRILAEVEKLVTPSVAAASILGQLPFSPRAKRVIELAGEVSSSLKHDVIGTEHILLALLKENESIAAQVLTNLGVKTLEVREMVLEVLGSNPPETRWSFHQEEAASEPKVTAKIRLFLLSSGIGIPSGVILTAGPDQKAYVEGTTITVIGLEKSKAQEVASAIAKIHGADTCMLELS